MTARITLQDMRAVKYCARGSRDFAARYKLDWARFVSEGIPVSELQHIDDGMLSAVIKRAIDRESADARR